ncbi:tetratricopeptide repeat protein [Aquimarina addita]|uniref:Tetratricopeptide repeat protein n=1 Tax=Aquimarina addita TaxID=870485 RepID=A0ABP7XCV3_9FLAO
MKNLIIIIIVFAISSLTLAQEQSMFQKANDLYTQEKYQEAIEAYESIIKSGQESAELYYNLGNANYKVNNIASSIYYYEKGLKLAPDDEDIKSNLAFARKSTIDAIDIIPEGFLTRTINGFASMFSFNAWGWISIIGVCAFVVLFVLYYYALTSTKKRLFFMCSWIGLGIGIIAVLFAFRQYNRIQENQYAIIFAQETTVKSEPNLKSEVIFELHEGTKVRITETINEWRKIRLADGKIGWIPATELKEL